MWLAAIKIKCLKLITLYTEICKENTHSDNKNFTIVMVTQYISHCNLLSGATQSRNVTFLCSRILECFELQILWNLAPDQLVFWQWVFALITAASLIDRNLYIVTLFHYFIELPFSRIIVQVQPAPCKTSSVFRLEGFETKQKNFIQ